MDLSNHSFNFENSGISALEYNAILNDIVSKNEVIDVNHSLPMNTIDVHLDPDKEYESYSVLNLPINNIEINKIDNREVLTVIFRTTKLLCSSEEEKRVFNADYCDESMAYIKSQLDLFENIDETILVRKDNQIRTMCAMKESVQNTYFLNDLLTYTGHTISNFDYKNGHINAVTIKFDETTKFNDNLVKSVRESKSRMNTNERFKDSEDLNLECSHAGKPDISIIRGTPDDITDLKFDKVTIEDNSYYKIVLSDKDRFNPRIDQNEDTDTETDYLSSICVKKGYVCDKCDTMYIPINKEQFSDTFKPNIKIETEKVCIPDTNKEFNFQIFNHPYKSI